MTNAGTSVPRAAVVLLNWNAAERTLRVARELLSWSTLRPIVIVVDNASSPQDRAQLSALPPPALFLPQDQNLGYAGGNNAGIEAALKAAAKVILLLNNDAHMDESAALRLAQVLAEHDDVGIVGPVLLETQANGREVVFAGGRNIALFPHTRRVLRGPPPGRLLDVDYVPGTAAMVRADVFQRIGLFDPAFFFSGEVADFCARARSAGSRCVIAPDVRAWHRKETASAAIRALYAYYTLRNRFLYVRKHTGRMAPFFRVYWVLMGSVSWVLAALKRQPDQQRAIGLALRDGWNEHGGSRNDIFLGHSNGYHS